jgi:hypothetical protein
LLWVGLTGGAVGLAAFVVWLVLQFSGGDLDLGDKLASIVSMSVTLVTLPLSVFAIVLTLRQSQQGQQPSPNAQVAERLDAMAEILAISVRAQWEAEEQIRRIHDPFPLPARWANAADYLMDHWQNINSSLDRRTPIVLDGQGDHLVDTFTRIPSGRLVVLGRAGAGKTILTSRFVLTLLSNRGSIAGQPVPVIFLLGSWDPHASSLRDWLAGQLMNNYPVLAERDGTGVTVAEQLLVTGRVMPVLDGFDEISEGLRADAIVGINAGLRTGDRLLLTSRPEEYAAAVAAGDVLTAAAVVSLKNLTADDVRSYLPLTTRKTGTDAIVTKWDPVLDRAYGLPGFSALADVLSTPLMVALARAIFSDTNADPAELLEYTSAAELEDRLLAGFVPAVYSRVRHDKQPCSAEDAHHYLGFLANHLQRLGTYDLAWWQLVTAVPRIVIGLACGFMIVLVLWFGVGLLTVLGSWTADGRMALLVAGAAVALVNGLAIGVVIGGRLHMRYPSPTRLQLQSAGRLDRLRHDLAFEWRSGRTLAWFLLWSCSGAIFGFATWRLLDSAAGVTGGLTIGFLSGVGAWLVTAVVRTLGVPVEPTKTIDPAELMDTDRATALRQGLMMGIGWATGLCLIFPLTFESLYGLPFGRVFQSSVWLLGWLWLLVVGAGVMIWVLCVTVWGQWLIARTWLPLTGRLPWSIMTFLADAHRRGVLRQAGGVYQFRHARLQNHLARRTADDYSLRLPAPQDRQAQSRD